VGLKRYHAVGVVLCALVSVLVGSVQAQPSRAAHEPTAQAASRATAPTSDVHARPLPGACRTLPHRRGPHPPDRSERGGDVRVDGQRTARRPSDVSSRRHQRRFRADIRHRRVAEGRWALTVSCRSPRGATSRRASAPSSGSPAGAGVAPSTPCTSTLCSRPCRSATAARVFPPDPFANGQCTYYAYERGPAQDFGKHADADVRGADFSGAPTQARRWKHSSPSVSGAPVASA